VPRRESRGPRPAIDGGALPIESFALALDVSVVLRGLRMRTQRMGRSHLTIKQATAILGVSPNTLRAWGAAGKIPEGRHPVNNYRLYRREDVEALRRQIEGAVSVKPKIGPAT